MLYDLLELFVGKLCLVWTTAEIITEKWRITLVA